MPVAHEAVLAAVIFAPVPEPQEAKDGCGQAHHAQAKGVAADVARLIDLGTNS